MNRINSYITSLFLMLLVAAAAHGAVFTVTRASGPFDGVCDGDCSLREAVETANAAPSDDIIVFLPSLSGSTINVGTEITISGGGSLTIEGLGADRLTITGGYQTNIFFVSSMAHVRFAGLKIANAYGEYLLRLDGVAINSSLGADIEIDRVNFTGNITEGVALGGAVFLYGGNNRISNSTFSGNSSWAGGALALSNGNTIIVNTTFSGNTAGPGGAICFTSSAVAKMRNVTITGNTGTAGGAIMTSAGSAVDIGNSVLAGNVGTANYPEIQREPNGFITSAGYNHIGDSAGDSTNTQVPIVWLFSDRLDEPPMLGSLQNNGGRTPTILPLTGSSLIDTGNNLQAAIEGLMIDQRGYARIVNGTVDKGAVESSASPAFVSVTGRVRDARGRGIPRARVTLTDMMGNKRQTMANSFGYYSFTGVAAAESYFVRAFFNPNTFPPLLVSTNYHVEWADIIAQ